MKSHKEATPDYEIHELIAQRWSPYAFADREVSTEDLRSLFEATRWAPSSYNEQPWRYIVATKADQGEFERVLSCLVDGNQVWARKAPVLALGCTLLRLARNGQPNAAALHDLGIANATLTFEATARGLFIHQMIGIVPERVRELFSVPNDVQPLVGLAIGHIGEATSLPDNLRERELTPRSRKPLAEIVYRREWGTASYLID